jgi:hypothetical protein
MITSDEVSRRIDGYFAGGVCTYLTPEEQRLAAEGGRELAGIPRSD